MVWGMSCIYNSVVVMVIGNCNQLQLITKFVIIIGLVVIAITITNMVEFSPLSTKQLCCCLMCRPCTVDLDFS